MKPIISVIDHVALKRPDEALGLINATFLATEVAGFICEVPLRGLEGEPPHGGFATEARSFQLLGVEYW